MVEAGRFRTDLVTASLCVILERMRQSKRCRHIPVVILSSSDAERDKADAVRLGATRYIRTPSKLDDSLSLGVDLQSGALGAERVRSGEALIDRMRPNSFRTDYDGVLSSNSLNRLASSFIVTLLKRM